MERVDGKIYLRKWARVGVTLHLDPTLWEQNQELAIKDAFRSGRVKLDGDAYFPEEADENDGDESDFDISGTIILKEDSYAK